MLPAENGVIAFPEHNATGMTSFPSSLHHLSVFIFGSCLLPFVDHPSPTASQSSSVSLQAGRFPDCKGLSFPENAVWIFPLLLPQQTLIPLIGLVHLFPFSLRRADTGLSPPNGSPNSYQLTTEASLLGRYAGEMPAAAHLQSHLHSTASTNARRVGSPL